MSSHVMSHHLTPYLRQERGQEAQHAGGVVGVGDGGHGADQGDLHLTVTLTLTALRTDT